MRASATASAPSAASPTTSMPRRRLEQADDAGAHDGVVVGDDDADASGHASSGVGSSARRRSVTPTRSTVPRRRRRPDRERAADERGAVADAGEPEPALAAASRAGPDAVVAHREHDLAAFGPTRDRRRVGACACLRTFASPSCAQRSSTTSCSRPRSAASATTVTTTPVSRSNVDAEAPQRVGEPGVGGDRRERRDEPARLGERLARHLLDELHVGASGCRGLAVDRAEPVARALRDHHESGEALRDRVVDLAGEPPALLGDARIAMHRGELALRRLQLVEQPRPFLAVLGDAGDPEPERHAEAERERGDAEPGEMSADPEEPDVPARRRDAR